MLLGQTFGKDRPLSLLGLVLSFTSDPSLAFEYSLVVDTREIYDGASEAGADPRLSPPHFSALSRTFITCAYKYTFLLAPDSFESLRVPLVPPARSSQCPGFQSVGEDVLQDILARIAHKAQCPSANKLAMLMARM